ncbi:MAG: hypothetical protein JW811_02975 [Clostridiales bacterium]|nr:hypothetical protein [Clostridiales bacterium]
MNDHSLWVADPAHLLPMLWMKGEDEETLRRGVRQVHASGCGALIAESRTHPDFMGEGWFHDIGVVLDECETLGLKLWILDDQHFPSGYAAGKATGTPYCRMMLREKHMDTRGPVKGGAFLAQDDETTLRFDEGVVAVIAAKRLTESDRQDAFEDIGGYKLGELVDITDTVRDGVAYWNVPEGIWRVFVLSASYVAERVPPRHFVNPLMPEGAQLMIDTVYRPHYERFGAAFGKTLMGFFSDEPALRAGRGYHGVLGEYPRIPIPWRAGLMDELKRALGDNARALLPGIWYDIGENSARVRYAVMDTVSRLYGENYAKPLGDWCRAHGVAYIGHVIEQNNTHARLGSGAGHFFRAIGGQDMAGIDVVLHEIRPKLRGAGHAWSSQDFEADEDFFGFMLAQMAVSAAHLDAKKQGRTVCEIFGAYGWQEDVAEMRYLANFMLSRGVNYFVPHAFTMQAFPDPDSPPHFDAEHNPMMPFIGKLFGAMARASGWISGGRPLARTAVLYYAEAEWANGTAACMKTQAVVKVLNQRQIECAVIPIDGLLGADFDLLLIPWAKRWPRKLLDRCRTIKNAGKTVCFIDAFPEALSEGEGDLEELLRGFDVVKLEGAAAFAAQAAPLPYVFLTDTPDVRLYPYRKGEETVFLLFNENTEQSVRYRFAAEDLRPARLLDFERQKQYAVQSERSGNTQEITVDIEPSQLLAAVFTGRKMPEADAAPAPLGDAETLSARWDISLRAMGEAGFTHYQTAETFFNVTAPDEQPRFSGTVRYETVADLPQGCAAVDLGECAGAAELWVDGHYAGTRLAPPYTFRFPPQKTGAHAIRAEVTNTAFYAHRDPLSFFACIKPTGIQGPVRYYREGV